MCVKDDGESVRGAGEEIWGEGKSTRSAGVDEKAEYVTKVAAVDDTRLGGANGLMGPYAYQSQWLEY
jgi:hypothetical protein